LNEKFSSKGIPVVLGECGASRKGGTYWENGGIDGMATVNRKKGKIVEPFFF
jgi:hypothetical protein